jgi:DNA-binding Lrp family transcriptional regulator
MSASLDTLDRQLIELLKVNARLPMVKLAKALGCARSTVQLRLNALEDSGVITGYTVGVAVVRSAASIRAMMLISTESKNEAEVVRALPRGTRPSSSIRSAAATACAPC